MLSRLFKRIHKSKIPTSNGDLDKKPKYYIPSNSSDPSKEYDLLLEEELFFDTLLEKSSHLKGEYSLLRLSDGTVNVSYNGYPIGKIKLQGRKKCMLYMKNLLDPISFEGELNDFINAIDKWVTYIDKYI